MSFIHFLGGFLNFLTLQSHITVYTIVSSKSVAHQPTCLQCCKFTVTSNITTNYFTSRYGLLPVCPQVSNTPIHPVRCDTSHVLRLDDFTTIISQQLVNEISPPPYLSLHLVKSAGRVCRLHCQLLEEIGMFNIKL